MSCRRGASSCSESDTCGGAMLEPGSKASEPAEASSTDAVRLTQTQWRVLAALKREFSVDEISARPLDASRRRGRADRSVTFLATARELEALGAHRAVLDLPRARQALRGGERVTRYNALFHWAVPAGREIEAGREVGRHHILTHAYWREGGPEFGNVNIMGVAHGIDKAAAARPQGAPSTRTSRRAGIPVRYTNVFWGGRSEIKPSEVMPAAYERLVPQGTASTRRR